MCKQLKVYSSRFQIKSVSDFSYFKYTLISKWSMIKNTIIVRFEFHIYITRRTQNKKMAIVNKKINIIKVAIGKIIMMSEDK